MRTVQEYKAVFEEIKARKLNSAQEMKQQIADIVDLKTELEKDDKVDKAFRAAVLVLIEDFRKAKSKFTPSDFVNNFADIFSNI